MINQIQRSNFAFLISFWEISQCWGSESSLIHNNESIYDLAAYGFLTALLGVGKYPSAEEFINSSATYRLRNVRINSITSTHEWDYCFAVADLDHLLNRYDLALETVAILVTKAVELGCNTRIGNAIWMNAHLTGHIAEDLRNAKNLYRQCIHQAQLSEDKLLALRAWNGLFAVSMATGDWKDYSEESIEAQIEECSSVNGSAPVRSALLRNFSRYYRITGKLDRARIEANKSKQIAADHGLRTLINCDYSFGEIERFARNYAIAIPHYKKVIDATGQNGDVNLLTSALLAVCICDLLAETPTYHSSILNVEESISHVMRLAEKHHMQATLARAEAVFTAMRVLTGEIDASCLGTTLDRFIQLGLKRDIEILSTSTVESLSQLEIHVH